MKHTYLSPQTEIISIDAPRIMQVSFTSGSENYNDYFNGNDAEDYNSGDTDKPFIRQIWE